MLRRYKHLDAAGIEKLDARFRNLLNLIDMEFNAGSRQIWSVAENALNDKFGPLFEE